ncbi:MAG TPA: hypothetical protein VGO31_01150 [Microbacteriaceae bacterium]|jgi:hypothetical protein|nr:hypothetical protein [Microbacteriaceae bacterium]
MNCLPDSYLFSKGELRGALEGQLAKLKAEIEAVSAEHFMQTDEEAWVAALVDEYLVRVPVLDTAGIWREEAQEVLVDVSHDPRRFWHEETRDRRVHGHRFVLHIPFKGDNDVFILQPNMYGPMKPRGKMNTDDVTFTVEYPAEMPFNVDDAKNQIINSLGQWLAAAAADAASFNSRLEGEVRGYIGARKARLANRDAQLATSTIPVGRPGSTKKAIGNVVTRRPAPRLPARTASAHRPIVLEPSLQEEIYDHILSVIRMAADGMEKHPQVYAAMGEEDRRGSILDTLNTHYEGRGTAEAFNLGGKTDILIQYDGRSIFICECKFWSGSKGFADSIDQLFGYTTWRDAKLAIIMFVREKNLTEIVARARSTLEEHPQFERSVATPEPTELRAVMKWPGDDARKLDLHVFLVHTIDV